MFALPASAAPTPSMTAVMCRAAADAPAPAAAAAAEVEDDRCDERREDAAEGEDKDDIIEENFMEAQTDTLYLEK